MNDGKSGTGDFTLPGEAGYEDLTLRLAGKWGADVIRDSDGTVLSPKILDSGYDIYSTLCLVRTDNAWAKIHRDKLQQNYLMSFPITAAGNEVTIDPLEGYFREQFEVNADDDPHEWWQVFDRTTGAEVPAGDWTYDAAAGTVMIKNAAKWHIYTVNFLAYRIWEEISMYNHITNDWGGREHLMSVEPMHPETRTHLLAILEKWLKEHPHTTVVRFTSMFYNFCWFWGDNPRLRYVYSDWGSYDFTVNPAALRAFEKKHGFRPSSEDFVNKGQYNSTHNAPSPVYRKWMDFINEFVVSFGRMCVDLVHSYGKKAYVFYDDHWIGVEPYGDRFPEFGFDGIIKCVFNGFEARKCAGVKGVKARELRLHPYLFPTGLKGEPTFKEGGNPALDAKRFWSNIRRALLREPVDRIGLGGYLHLVEPFPDFVEYIGELAGEFRLLKSFHGHGRPYSLPGKIGILTAWGKLRSWICSGHLHEHPEVELTNVLESLSGLPFDVEFLSFDDIRERGIPAGMKAVINAGRAGSAWSGGFYWDDPEAIGKISEWVHAGGGFVGIAEPSALDRNGRYFQLAHILGVDRDTGAKKSLNHYTYECGGEPHFITVDNYEPPDFGKTVDGIFLFSNGTRVLTQLGGCPGVSVNTFGRGRAVYFSGYTHSIMNTRLLHRALCWAGGNEDEYLRWSSSNPYIETAYYAGSGKLVVINNSGEEQSAVINGNIKEGIAVTIGPLGLAVIETKENQPVT